MTSDLSIYQPGQELVRRDSLRAVFMGANKYPANINDPYPYRVCVYISPEAWATLTYSRDGRCRNALPNQTGSDIIGPKPANDYRWQARISDDHVEATCGFWAVHQGESK
jgi:hypothetical protein